VGYRIRADPFGDFDLLLRDQRARYRRAEQILPLVNRIRPEHWKHIIADELFAQILDEDVFRLDAEQQRLLPRRLEFLALTEIGGEGDDLATVSGLQPFQDDRRVKPARIGEHHLLHVLAHEYLVKSSRDNSSGSIGRGAAFASVYTAPLGPVA